MKLKYNYSFQKYDNRYLAIIDFTEENKERRLLWVNECGKRIMELLKEDTNKDDIISTLMSEYDGDIAIIKSSIDSFVEQLLSAGLII